MNHVVAIADKSDFEPVQFPFVLYQRETIGEHLAGVIEIRERVDHRNRSVLSHFFDNLF